MSTPLDPFSQSFDAIDVDPARAPSAAALDRALAFCAPTAAEPESAAPGFYLIDSAGGRFAIDREMGVITLADDVLLAAEPNTVHAVRMRVIEPSGLSYELSMRLRITGRVPQMVGAEEFAGLANAAVSALTETPAIAPLRPAISWQRFAAARAATSAPASLTGANAPFGALMTTELPSVPLERAALTPDCALPAAASAGADWRI